MSINEEQTVQEQSIECNYQDETTIITGVSKIIENSEVFQNMLEDNYEFPIPQFVNPEIINYILYLIEFQDIEQEIYSIRENKDLLIKLTLYCSEIDLKCIHDTLCSCLLTLSKQRYKEEYEEYEDIFMQLDLASLYKIFRMLPENNYKHLPEDIDIVKRFLFGMYKYKANSKLGLVLTILYFQSQAILIDENTDFEYFNFLKYFTYVRLTPKFRKVNIDKICMLNQLETLHLNLNDTTLVNLYRGPEDENNVFKKLISLTHLIFEIDNEKPITIHDQTSRDFINQVKNQVITNLNNIPNLKKITIFASSKISGNIPNLDLLLNSFINIKELEIFSHVFIPLHCSTPFEQLEILHIRTFRKLATPLSIFDNIVNLNDLPNLKTLHVYKSNFIDAVDLSLPGIETVWD